MLRCKWQGCCKQLASVDLFNLHLAEHMVSDSTPPDSTPPNSPLACNEPGCGKQFTAQRGLTIHRNNTHPAAACANWLPCNVCGTKFKFKKNLAKHALNHLTQSPSLVCQVVGCGKQLSSRHSLARHAGTHRDLTPTTPPTEGEVDSSCPVEEPRKTGRGRPKGKKPGKKGQAETAAGLGDVPDQAVVSDPGSADRVKVPAKKRVRRKEENVGTRDDAGPTAVVKEEPNNAAETQDGCPERDLVPKKGKGRGRPKKTYAVKSVEHHVTKLNQSQSDTLFDSLLNSNYKTADVQALGSYSSSGVALSDSLLNSNDLGFVMKDETVDVQALGTYMNEEPAQQVDCGIVPCKSLKSVSIVGKSSEARKGRGRPKKKREASIQCPALQTDGIVEDNTWKEVAEAALLERYVVVEHKALETPDDLDAFFDTMWHQYMPVVSNVVCGQDAGCGLAGEERQGDSSIATSEPTLAKVKSKRYKPRPKSRQKKAKSDDSVAWLSSTACGASSEPPQNDPTGNGEMKRDLYGLRLVRVKSKPYKPRPKSRQKKAEDESDAFLVALSSAFCGTSSEPLQNDPTKHGEVVPTVTRKPYKARPKSRQKKAAEERDGSASGEQDENVGTMLLPPDVQGPCGDQESCKDPELLLARRLFFPSKQLQAIVGISKINPLTFRVKWSGVDRLQDVPSSQLRLAFPRRLIEWYNERLELQDYQEDDLPTWATGRY